MRFALALLPLLLATDPACADPLREFCGQRPGIGTSACIVDPGHLQIEAALADWTLDKQPETRTDTILSGDLLARYGLSESLEAQVGWTAFGHVRERERTSGAVSHDTGIGDVLVALKQSLHNPDGSGFSVALLPFATLPIGHRAIGFGDWSAGLMVPISYDLNDTLQLGLTPEIDAAVDEDGNGRHLAFSGVVGLSAHLSETVSGSLEYQALRDRDPAGHETRQLVGISFGWLAQQQLQLDLGGNAGLGHAAPDVELYVGVSRKF